MRQLILTGLCRTKKAPREPFLRSPKFRLALSLSLVLLIHRILYRFFVRLRANLRTDDARPFRERNPRFSQALTSKYAPVVGASLAGAALGVCPQSKLRVTVAIYMATRSLEFLYNALGVKGYLKYKPWWFGSWLLMPVSCAQLFHAFVFDRETIPKVCRFARCIRRGANFGDSGWVICFCDFRRVTSQIGLSIFRLLCLGLVSMILLIPSAQLLI